MTFRFEFLLDEREQVRASRVMHHRRWSTRIAYGSLALLGLVGVPVYLEAVASGRNVPSIVVPIGLAGLAGAFGVLYMGPHTSVRALRKSNRAAGGPHVYTFDDIGLHIVSPGAQTSIDWANFIETHETKDFILFYYAKSWAALLPKRVLASGELEAFRLAIRGWLGTRASLGQ